MRGVSDELLVMTDDGSYGDKGLVTDKLRALIEESDLSLDALYAQASKSCYIGAQEALELGLIVEILH